VFDLAVANNAAIFADEAAPLIDNSKASFAGVINSNDVYVRSGPGENYYATLKLDKGAPVCALIRDIFHRAVRQYREVPQKVRAPVSAAELR